MNIANLNTSKTRSRTNRSAACLTAALLLALGASFGAGAQTACLTAADSPETGATVCAAQLTPRTSGTNQIDRGVTPDGIVEGSRLQAQAFVPKPSAPAGASLELHTAGGPTTSGFQVQVLVTTGNLPAGGIDVVAAVIDGTASQYVAYEGLERLVNVKGASFLVALSFSGRIDLADFEVRLAQAFTSAFGASVLVP